jgi:hypothetical protein
MFGVHTINAAGGLYIGLWSNTQHRTTVETSKGSLAPDASRQLADRQRKLDRLDGFGAVGLKAC